MFLGDIDDRWIGGIDEKLKNISYNIIEIKDELKKSNGRTGRVEFDVAVLKINNEKNCKSITSLWKKINDGVDAKLTRKNQVAIIIAFITGISSIVVAIVMKVGG